MLAEFTGETLALASWTPSGGTLLLRCCEGVASGLFPWLSLVQPLYIPYISLVSAMLLLQLDGASDRLLWTAPPTLLSRSRSP
jgi:hypothetical protein